MVQAEEPSPYNGQYQQQQSQPFEYYQQPVGAKYQGDDYEGTLLKTVQQRQQPEEQYYYQTDPYTEQLIASTLRKQQIPVLSNSVSPGQPVPLAPLSPPISAFKLDFAHF